MEYLVLLPVEINGEIRKPGDLIDESEFNPVPAEDEVRERTPEEEEQEPLLSEIDSLIETGHITNG